MGLKTNDLDQIKIQFGDNVFRPLKVTSIGATIQNMFGDISMQFLLIAAMVATVLEMT